MCETIQKKNKSTICYCGVSDMVTMKSIKYQFGLLIFAYLFLVGCGDRADEGVTNEDIALQTESVNKELEMV